MLNLWQDSLYLSTMAFVLAEHSKLVHPDDALLAGLMADIGAIPIIYYAEQSGGVDDQELSKTINSLSSSVGVLVLKTLGFAEHLQIVPELIENWYHDGGKHLELIDILILARLHQKLGRSDIPLIHTLPSYIKLEERRLTPEFSFFLIQQSQQRIQAALKTFD